jgi:hypothetical protein
MVDVIEAIYWFGTDRGVKFSEASSKRIAWAQEEASRVLHFHASSQTKSSAFRRAASASLRLSRPTSRP